MRHTAPLNCIISSGIISSGIADGRLPSMAPLQAGRRRRLAHIAAGLAAGEATGAREAIAELAKQPRVDAVPVPPLEGAMLEKFEREKHQDLFMPPPPDTVEEMAAQLVADGFLHLPGALTPEQREEFIKLSHWTMQNPRNDEHYRDGQPAPDVLSQLAPGEDPDFDNAPAGTGWHVKNVWNRRPEYLSLADLDPTCSIAEQVLGDDCHLIGMTSWVTGPGRSDQGLHTDYLPIDGIPPELIKSGRVKMPVFLITAHYYLDDMHEEMGPTKFIKGSHVEGRRPGAYDDGENHLEGMPAQSLNVKGGDCVMFRCVQTTAA